MSDTRKDCGSAIRIGMAIKKIAIPNSLKSSFIWLFPDASPFVYTRLRGKGFLCEVVRSGSLAAFLTFNLISRHKGTKFPDANAGAAFCRPAPARRPPHPGQPPEMLLAPRPATPVL